jgi:hypothetical protein
MMAPRSPSPTWWVKVTDTSAKPAAASWASCSPLARIPAMQPTQAPRSARSAAEVVSAEETSVQVQAASCEALQAEGLTEQVAARLDDTLDLTVDDPARPVLLAMSDNGPQMTSGSTREFLALCAIHQHFGRPGTPTDQAWIESLFGHARAEWPPLAKVEVVPRFVDLEVAVPHLSPAVW